MAKIKNNGLVMGARGNFSKQFVYRKRGDELHISKMPAFNKNATITSKQEKVRDMFAAASLYAKGAIASPELKPLYEKKASTRTTAFNVAFRDFQKAPKIREIKTGEYTGAISSRIIVDATDDFKVVKVKVSVKAADGSLIEEGAAELNPINRNLWIYTVKQTVASLAGTIITATAFDLPENQGTLELTL